MIQIEHFLLEDFVDSPHVHASLRGVQSEQQPRHVVKLPTRACLVLTDRGDKYIKHYTIN